MNVAIITGAGSGIGLATVQRIVLAYGGRVSVRSRPGEGATFTVRLPITEPTPSQSPDPTRTASPPSVH